MTQLRLSGIRACVFDAYGTLFDVNSAAAQAKDALGEKWQPLADLWRTKQLQYTWLRGLMGLYLTLTAYPEVKDTLKRLKDGGFKLAILSNGAPKMLAAAVANSGIADLMDAVLSVEEVKVFKPHPSVYGLATRRFGLEREQICFLSSNSWDAHAAKAFGFHVIWCNRFGQVPERIPERPDVEIGTLSALPEILGV